MIGIYRERAYLVAHLSKLYPSTIGVTDHSEPDWAVVTVESPAGQMTWHVDRDDLDLFGHLKWDHDAVWDGHTTEEKYDRLASL